MLFRDWYKLHVNSKMSATMIPATIIVLVFIISVSMGYGEDRIDSLNAELTARIDQMEKYNAKAMRKLKRSLNEKFSKRIVHDMSNLEDSLNNKFDNRLEGIWNDLKANIKSDLKTNIVPSLLPEYIRNEIHDLIKSGELDQLVKRTEIREVQAMKRTSQQMKLKLNLLAIALSRIEEERRKYIQSVKKYETALCQLKLQSTSSREISTAPPRVKGTSTYTEDNYSLLVAPFKGGRFSEVDLRSSRKRTHPKITNNIVDVIYNPRTQNIIWSNDSNPRVAVYSAKVDRTPIRGIYSANVDGSDVRLISRKKADNMALDSHRSRLFYTSWDNNNAVMSIDLNSGSETKLTILRFWGYSDLCLHARKELLFVRRYHTGILQVNYNGSNETVLLKGSQVYCITADEDNDVLYYVVEDRYSYIIKRYSLLTSAVTFVLRPSYYVTRLLYFRNLLFIAPGKGNSEIFNLKTNSTPIFDIDFGYKPVVCFIPKEKS